MLIFYAFKCVSIAQTDGTCSPTFVVDEFSGFFLHPSSFY